MSEIVNLSYGRRDSRQPCTGSAAIGARHIQAVLLTGGFLCCYAMRVCMSVSIVDMTDTKKPGHYDWDEKDQNLVISSFFWGYVLTQIPGGMVAQHWGARRLFGTAVGMCGVLTLALPIVSKLGGLSLTIASRVGAGLCQGVVPPILHTLLAKWVPLQERGLFTSFVYSGGWIGNVIAMQSSGLLCGSSLGWPSSFYFWGTIAVLWSLAWYCFGRESPAEHPSIAPDEKLYIESSLGIIETSEPVSTPWKSILSSVPVWALLITQWTQTWGFWLLLSKIPTYMGKVLKYDIQSNGFMSSLPYLTAWLVSFPVSISTDWAIRNGKMSVRTSRKLCNSFGMFVPALALVGLCFVEGEGQQTLAVLILVLSVASNIAIYCGHHVNHMDLSGNFAGPIMGFTNAAANLSSIIAPLVHSAMVPDAENVHQWNKIFLLTAGLYVLGALTFLIFGSTQVQKWNDPTNIKKNKHFSDLPIMPETFKEKKTEEKIER
ncbi:hypothetical protein QAD02_015695 [Eretmocerus hayati]|uniref:Uncharacterized protein n=1 Tax=Eretmocerus hayati TaxID=131215 RepID=A0ACC2P9Y3_9HYME|nr:hypothetical protein QAD02_015695 [Eretmocerus hayati]